MAGQDIQLEIWGCGDLVHLVVLLLVLTPSCARVDEIPSRMDHTRKNNNVSTSRYDMLSHAAVHPEQLSRRSLRVTCLPEFL